jgi:hypothetical protein
MSDYRQEAFSLTEMHNVFHNIMRKFGKSNLRRTFNNTGERLLYKDSKKF